MAAPLYSQCLGNQGNRMVNGDVQPEIIVFADGQALIESAKRVEQGARHHDSRWTDQAELKAATENIPRRLFMLALRVDPNSATHPNLISLANLDLRMRLQERDLDFKLLRKPKVVGIEKRKVAPARDAHASISRGRHAPLGLLD